MEELRPYFTRPVLQVQGYTPDLFADMAEIAQNFGEQLPALDAHVIANSTCFMIYYKPFGFHVWSAPGGAQPRIANTLVNHQLLLMTVGDVFVFDIALLLQSALCGLNIPMVGSELASAMLGYCIAMSKIRCDLQEKDKPDYYADYYALLARHGIQRRLLDPRTNPAPPPKKILAAVIKMRLTPALMLQFDELWAHHNMDDVR
ncbi:MAG: hypothetical protein A2848_03210 [Candidatus Magasanikbacteria bacterium RIFCSPHIGHO2_01_FULL_50_8]|uniref:Uncharacterized protein n=1 Tax=Candidatus Magasanikbacteria bacterium RIFCSPHIGHO2_01_FULL_50_8 TaxID=1798674 RepID=A0A1F6LMC2_9BACT|nr:MAG: hypothetical protein A2848_03210 [Candidatus Magasanikbacteria bacterium RIFCSPHIGHO2_01_FULL_50_8]